MKLNTELLKRLSTYTNLLQIVTGALLAALPTFGLSFTEVAIISAGLGVVTLVAQSVSISK